MGSSVTPTCLYFAVPAAPQVFSKLKKYSKTPDFKADTVGKVSVACRSLCMWVLAMEHYHDVYKVSQICSTFR